jgi:pimeloyl-ACP methyl ester carboxylesterase
VSETIFMVHGMFCAPWVWDNFRTFFEAQGYRCITPTLRFHDMDTQAAPDPRLGTTSLLDYAQDLEAEIRELATQPIVMGHSMGGLLAQILGSRGLGRALVLLNPAPPYGNRVFLNPAVLRGFWSALTTWGFWKRPARQTFAEAVYLLLHLMPAHEQRETYDKFVYESGRAACELAFWFADPKEAAQVVPSKVDCPVLVVAGTKDRIVSPSISRWVAARYEAVATYREFENHAHWVVAEPGWRDVAEYVAGWLTQVVPETA